MQRHSDSPGQGIFVLFGATGDLAWRKIIPALFQLFRDGALPPRFSILGVGRTERSDGQLREHFRSRLCLPDDDAVQAWNAFAPLIHYLSLDLKSDDYDPLSARISALTDNWQRPIETLFYLSTPPDLFAHAATGLGRCGLAESAHARLMVEKPLGHDRQSFHRIETALKHYFPEKRILRVDHFLGKETVQNILALRFANPVFEPVWNRRYVDHVAITVAETLGVEDRGPFYDKTGALRDMLQNHLLQLLCLTALEPPVTYTATDLQNRRADVMHAIRPVSAEQVPQIAVRGQYGPGTLDGEPVPGYCSEPGVAADSQTETFAAVKLHVDNWRWEGVPFYLRTGKRMAADISEISIRFRSVPHCAFPNCVGFNREPCRLVIRLTPDEGIFLKFLAKRPGSELELVPVRMHFTYSSSFGSTIPDAYHALLCDALRADRTFFMRADQVDMAWQLVDPIIDYWQNTPATFPNYAAGSWGPAQAETLIETDSRAWRTPTLKDFG